MSKTLFVLLLVLCGCTNTPYHGEGSVGPDEFVMDSYKIREGKFSILEMEGKDVMAISPSCLEEYANVIHNGDVLDIALYHPNKADLSACVQQIADSVGYTVEHGKLHLPRIAAVEIAGLTLEEARCKIEEAYCAIDPTLEVFIAYKDRLHDKVQLAGAVDVPHIAVDGKLRLFEVLAQAKVPASANLFKSYLLRDNQFLPVDFYKLIKEGDMSQNIVMRGGDKIYIADAADANVLVLGEVGAPGVYDLKRGFMTLTEALAQAKGITPDGDRRYIQIVRGSMCNPKIYTLHWQHILGLPSDSLLLMPGDIVYVAATPITEWSRFITKLLPPFFYIGFEP